jgi:hypothetical protein
MQQWMPSVPKNYRGVYLPYTWFLVNAGLLVAYMRRRDDGLPESHSVRTASAAGQPSQRGTGSTGGSNAGEAML